MLNILNHKCKHIKPQGLLMLCLAQSTTALIGLRVGKILLG